MKKLVVTGTLLMLFATQIASATVSEWSVALGGNGHFYEAMLAPEGITWSSADAAARASGGYLATIASAAENEFVYGLVAAADYWWQIYEWRFGPWLGGFQRMGSPEPAEGWEWVSGEPFDYTNWLPGEPSNASIGAEGENRLHFIGRETSSAFYWNDLAGEATESANHQFPHGYLVEYDPVPEPFALLALLAGLGSVGCLVRRRRR